MPVCRSQEPLAIVTNFSFGFAEECGSAAAVKCFEVERVVVLNGAIGGGLKLHIAMDGLTISR